RPVRAAWRYSRPWDVPQFVATTALPVVHLPDLVVDVLSSDERRQLLLIVPAVGVEHFSDEARARATDPDAADAAGQIPVNRSTEGVLEVIPDEPLRGAEQVAERYITVERLGGKRRFEHD